ncbi:MAG: 3-hydroxyacyl-[acyl-carrier-protein] dehydratase FabZ [Gammaproteobacteria bacterium RIFCSPLOWO2_02_FULL_61_13]|nr:MAG: 3-hydroxyacyl-[acyl-carrier-protein] dehydratase FabZ [Gammaproteobacteria bacterium RIFCSPLOWO2_02_FULL_61_13]
MDVNQIKEILPHRYPFLLIDRVLEIVPGQRIRAIKNVSVNEPYFPGHFPQKPLMPGVLIIEALAQAAAILGEISAAESHQEGVLYYLVGIDNARFRRPVGPGDQLLLEVTFQTVRRNIWKFSGTASVGDLVVASTDLLTTVSEPNP